jgi:hypothetical protein
VVQPQAHSKIRVRLRLCHRHDPARAFQPKPKSQSPDAACRKNPGAALGKSAPLLVWTRSCQGSPERKLHPCVFPNLSPRGTHTLGGIPPSLRPTAEPLPSSCLRAVSYHIVARTSPRSKPQERRSGASRLALRQPPNFPVCSPGLHGKEPILRTRGRFTTGSSRASGKNC